MEKSLEEQQQQQQQQMQQQQQQHKLPPLLSPVDNETLFDESAMNACLDFPEDTLDINSTLLMTPITTTPNAGDQMPMIPPVVKDLPILDFPSFFPMSDVLHSELYVIK